jgi:lipopolysaccharide transport system ATP-binding protein
VSARSPNAIVLADVAKSFKKRSRRREFTTLKTELVRLLSFKRKLLEASTTIDALKHIDLIIPHGQTVAIVGRNGSGKSTLLKLITGIYSATSGTVTVNGRISALLELGAGFHPDFTGRENIFINGIILGMSRAELERRVEEIIEFAELGDFIDEQVRTYSSGMFMRLAFAVATHVDPDVLIIDEILSVGDEHFQRKSQAKMNEFRRSGKTIILVTHSLEVVESWCDTAVWIDGGTVRMHGRPIDVVREYRRAVSAAETQAQKTGHSALSAPGLALPGNEVAPQVEPLVQVASVRLRTGTSDAQPELFGSTEPLRVLVDWRATEATRCQFSVDLLSADGRLVFSASHDAGVLQGTGTVQLELARLGLGEGSYELAVLAKAAGRSPPPPTRAGLKVGPDASATGLLRPVLAWSQAGSV